MPRKRKRYDKDYILSDSITDEKQDISPLQEIPFMPSTIETIDRALFDHIDDILNIFCTTNKGWTKVPLIWTGAERAYQIKHDKDLRDKNGFLIYPLMSLERTSIAKDITKRATLYAPITTDNTITVARKIKQDKTANFANADSKRLILNSVGTGQSNFPRANDKVVYQTITMPMPIYLDINYKLVVQTEYQQQINDIITPFMTSPGGINYFVVKKDGHRFEVFMDSEYALENNAGSLMTDARGYKTEITFRVLGYIIGADKNQDGPKLIKRENAVEVKLPREHVILGDIPEVFHISGNVPFYRD